MLYAILKPLVALVGRLVFGLRSRGTEHVPATGPVLLVANHVSHLDSPLIGAASPRYLSFLAKARDAIAVDTTDLGVEQVVETMLRTIESQCCTRS